MTDSDEQSIGEWVNDIHQGDVLETLAEMPESSVHSVVTSPPYFGLRDYGVDGQIGLEENLDEYIETLVDVGEALRRVLRDDGNWWLNLGDSFSGSGGSGGQWTEESHGTAQYAGDAGDSYNGPLNQQTLARKQKMLVPHRVAIALQDAGWWVRGDTVWAKPNGMPQSVKDRFTEKKEFIFHLTPAPDYYFDLDAVREPHSTKSLERTKQGPVNADTEGRGTNDDLRPGQLCHENGKNPGDWWEIPVKPYPEAHFAVYPEELVERPIKATCPEGGIVLDPFAGAGTTCLVAKRLGRRFIGIDLNPEYVAMAQKRVGITVDEPEYLLDDGETSLTAYGGGGE